MIDINEPERQKRVEKARRLRCKKAVVVGMNLDDIKQWMWDAFDSLEDVTYVTQNDDMFLDAFDGDEEEAFEFRLAFNSLAGDIERFRNDLEEQWIPDCFDDFFCACAGRGEEIVGYDAADEDYFGLGYYEAIAGQDEARKRLERLTKRELVEAAQSCYQVAVAYLGLRSRYEDLRAAIDIIRARNDGLLGAIKRIEELYERWSRAEYECRAAPERELDAIAGQLPDEVWLR